MRLIDADNSQIMKALTVNANSTERTGHWFKSEVYDKIYICSECGEYGYNTFNYCPNCGAKMIEPQESEEV